MSAPRPTVSRPATLSRRGGRIFLRPPRDDDRREFLALRRASRAFHAPFEVSPPAGVAANGPRAFRAFLEQGAGTRRERWLVCARPDGAILGSFTIGSIRGEPFQSAVLGYWIGTPHARQGFMKEALPLVVRRAFKDLRLRRLEANVLPENLASQRLLRGAGFELEGISRQFARIAGRWRDHQRWALLRYPGINDPSRAGTGSPG